MRIRGNSIRLRLTKSEVAQFGEKGLVEEKIKFCGGGKLIYALESKVDAQTTSAEFTDNRVAVTISETRARQWAFSDEIEIEAEQEIAEGESLKILIEKDFACLKPRDGEDDRDAFPHPAEGAKC